LKLLLLSALLLTSQLSAFDTRSHVWIAQEVINDLEDSKLTIPPYGEFFVDPSIVSSILENKKIYRMGNIGPDGFPDVIGGQVTVHPGLEDGFIDDESTEITTGWKSDVWFKWLLSKAQTPQEKAFAYGFLAHGAADTFAHTYVNMYSGDIFDMNDGETDVEKRHIFLEKFISDRLPSFKDVNATDLGEAYQLVAVDDELPINFIKNTLLMNDEVAQQYALSSTANYLAMMYDFRQKIAGLDDEDTQDTLNIDIEEASIDCDTQWYLGKYFLSIFSSQDEACEEKSFLTEKLDSLSLLKTDYSLPVYSFKAAWLEQIDHAIDEYIKMSSRMSQGFMNQDADTYSELTEWLQCYAASFTDPTTLAAQVVEETCNITAQAKDKLSFLDTVKDKTNFTGLSNLKSEVNTLSGSLGSSIVSLVGVAALEIITVRDQAVSEQSLNEQFSIDDSEKQLLLINDIAERVKLEMGLDMNGELNPQMYHVMYNAVVLSKLSLLSELEINRLIATANVSQYYQYASSDNNFNILFGAIKTIDGNHQWLHQAPPYPRLENFNDTQDHFHGYESDESHGFKFFEHEQLRSQVFSKIFKGPLSLGLESPAAIQKSNILASDYPYISCFNNPFPNGIDDKKCLVIQNDNVQDINLTNPEIPIQEESWWDSLVSYLTNIIKDYFNELVGEENIISTTTTDDSVEITTTIPDDGIQF
jgi:hypothetical protein